MKPPESDDDLRSRFRELREQEAAHAPSFESIRRQARAGAAHADGNVFWLQPAWVAAALTLFALGGGWWVAWRRDEPRPSAAHVAPDAEIIEAAPSLEGEWTTATDSLLADADGAAATSAEERLTREIAALLHP